MNSFYVDDIVTGAKDEEQACALPGLKGNAKGRWIQSDKVLHEFHVASDENNQRGSCK